jgi:hypothetical protein
LVANERLNDQESVVSLDEIKRNYELRVKR